MPNRAKRAAARQSQLGQRRRKERKDRGLPNQPEATIAKPLEPLTSTIVAEDVLDEVPRVATQVSTPQTDRGSMPAQPYLRSDLTRIGMVAVLSTAIVIGSAVIL